MRRTNERSREIMSFKQQDRQEGLEGPSSLSSFASLRAGSERSEGSHAPGTEILSEAKDDILLPILVVKIHYRARGGAPPCEAEQMNREDTKKYLQLLGQELQQRQVTGQILLADGIVMLLDVRKPQGRKGIKAYLQGDKSAIDVLKSIDHDRLLAPAALA